MVQLSAEYPQWSADCADLPRNAEYSAKPEKLSLIRSYSTGWEILDTNNSDKQYLSVGEVRI